MEHISPKMAGAFGVGFIGFIFAAYSYNQQHKNEFIHYSNDNTLDISENTIKSNDALDKSENNDTKEEVTSFFEDIKKKTPTWGKFWKSEYENMRNKNNENKKI